MSQSQRRIVRFAEFGLLLLFLFPPMLYEDGAYSVEQSGGHCFFLRAFRPPTVEEATKVFGTGLIENGLVKPSRVKVRISGLRAVTECLFIIFAAVAVYRWLDDMLSPRLTAASAIVTLALSAFWVLLVTFRL